MRAWRILTWNHISTNSTVMNFIDHEGNMGSRQVLPRRSPTKAAHPGRGPRKRALIGKVASDERGESGKSPMVEATTSPVGLAEPESRATATAAKLETISADEAVALYSLEGVRASLAMRRRRPAHSGARFDAGGGEEAPPADTEHQVRLGEILADGEDGRWRRAIGPDAGSEEAVRQIAGRAPHFGELSDLVRLNLRAATNMRVPIFLSPVLLVGEPGTGKTWFLSRLAASLRVPFRSYAMSMSTLGEGLQGAHPSWRNAAPGLVAKTLLREREANPVIFVDEFDKAGANGHNVDPYRPFYALLDPSGARAFTDEYLGFEIDASKVLWVMAANDCTSIPRPILDRLVVMHVPDMTVEQRMAVVESIYADVNAARRGYFAETLAPDVAEALASMTPRSMRIALEHAMTRAAAEARRSVSLDDVRTRQAARTWRVGFR